MSRKKEPTYITEQHAFPQRLQQLMKEHGTTQKQLGTAIGKRPQTVSLYACGQSSPDADTIRAISDYYNVSADWLLGRPGSVMTIDADVQAVCRYTGLSETAVRTLHNVDDEEVTLIAIEEKLPLFDHDARAFIQTLIDHPDKFLDALGHITIAASIKRQIGDEYEEKEVRNMVFGFCGPRVILPALDGIRYHRQEACNIFTEILGEWFERECREIEEGQQQTKERYEGEFDADNS